MVPRLPATLPHVPRSRAGTSSRGVAILSVITVLVALLLIAIPFVISQKLGRDRTESSAAQDQAKFEADLVCRSVVSYLHATHPQFEEQRRTAGATGVDADETVDSLGEFMPDASYRKVIADLMRSEPGRAASVSDPRGSIWSWKVTDANALINPNGASPYLIGNLLGAANLSDDLDAAATTIPVEAIFPTPAMGLVAFRKDGGYLRIGGETIRYASFEDGSFKGCVRGTLADAAPLQDNGPGQEHKKGERVIDYLAYKLATHLISANPGTTTNSGLTSFENLDDLKSIQRWGGGGGFEADRFEQVRPFFTVSSRRETAETFLDGQLLAHSLPEAGSSASGETLTVRDRVFTGGNAAYFNPGVVVRLSDGKNIDYATVLRAGDDKGGQIGDVFTISRRLPEGRTYDGGRTMVQPLAAYPIDVNTASQEVLAAVFAGLRLRTVDDAKDVVTPEVAWSLAGRLVADRSGPLMLAGEENYRKSGPLRNPKDFGLWLKGLLSRNEIGARQGDALLRNAVNPHDNELAFGTAPFCYRTLDVYHVEGRAVVNDAAGQKAAEAAWRQVVEIGADRSTVWALDSQSDFELGLGLGSGGKFTETYPFNVAFVNDSQAHVQPRRRAPQWWGPGIWPSDVRSDDLGDVRLQASRIKLPNHTFSDEFDSSVYSDGWFTTAAGAYSQPTSKVLRQDTVGDTFIHPFTVSFWMRPYSNGNWFAFDTGKENDQNRISIFVRDAAQGGGKELVLRVCDATLEQEGAEIYVPLTRLGYQAETWYHLQANVRGCDPMMMELLIDGLSVGLRRGLTYLSAGLSSDATTVSVESAEGFGPTGALQIGTEIVEYDTRQAQSFTECARGTRGTRVRDWPVGTAVKRVGYSHPIVLDVRKGGAGLEANTEWEKWDYLQLMYDEDQVSVTINGVSVMFKGAKEDTKKFSATVINPDPNDSSDISQRVKTFNTKGYALLSVREYDPAASSSGGGAARRGMASGQGLLASAPNAPPPAGGGAAPPHPGGGVPGGLRPPSDSGGTPPPPSTPPSTGGGGTPTPGGGAPPPGGTPSSGPKIGGWEVVYYTRTGTTLNIERFMTTALHNDSGTPYFLATVVTLPNGDQMWPARLIPISVPGVSTGTGGLDYWDPTGNTEDRMKLEKFAHDGDPDGAGPDIYSRPRVLVGSDNPGGANEVICYDSIDRKKASPALLFCRDREADLKNLRVALMVDVTIAGPNDLVPATGTTPTPTPSPTPTPPTPTPPTPTPPSTGGGGFVGPGGSVPPGLRTYGPNAGIGLRPGVSGLGASGLGAAGIGPFLRPKPMPDGGSPAAPPAPSGGGEPLPTAPDAPSESGPSSPSPGGAGPGAGRDPPADNSGGDGTPPGGGTPEHEGNTPPVGTRPSADAPTSGTPSGGGGSTSGLPSIDSIKTVFPFRGANGTGDHHHAPLASSDKDAILLPCFRIRRTDPDTGIEIGGPQPGFNDVVTFSTGATDTPRREQRRVRWSHGLPNAGARSSWVALSEFIEGEPFEEDAGDIITADYRGKTRMMCFPSGELPDESGQNVSWMRNEVGGGSPVTGFLDEVFVWRQQRQPLGRIANSENVSEKEKEIIIQAIPPATTFVGFDGYDKDCGVIDVDGELIVYRESRIDGSDTITLSDCRRGALGTKARAHGVGVLTRFVPNIWVSFLDGNVNKDAATIPLARTREWPKEGAARIVGEETVEIIHYTGLSESGLVMPESLDADSAMRGRGLLRGRFGTEAIDHEGRELVVWQPFRFWDRTMIRRGTDTATYVGMHEHPEGSYVEFAKTVRDAVWRRVSWTENVDGRTSGSEDDKRGRDAKRDRTSSSKMDVLVVARFQQGVPWDSSKVVDLRGDKPMPSDAREHPDRYLYLLDDPEAANRFDVEETTLELRVYFPYLLGAYAPQEQLSADPNDLVFENSWKATPWLRSFSVEYVNRTKVRSNADIR